MMFDKSKKILSSIRFKNTSVKLLRKTHFEVFS